MDKIIILLDRTRSPGKSITHPVRYFSLRGRRFRGWLRRRAKSDTNPAKPSNISAHETKSDSYRICRGKYRIRATRAPCFEPTPHQCRAEPSQINPARPTTRTDLQRSSRPDARSMIDTNRHCSNAHGVGGNSRPDRAARTNNDTHSPLPARVLVSGQPAIWRSGPESNRHPRICSPMHHHSATGPPGADAVYGSHRPSRSRAGVMPVWSSGVCPGNPHHIARAIDHQAKLIDRPADNHHPNTRSIAPGNLSNSFTLLYQN